MHIQRRGDQLWVAANDARCQGAVRLLRESENNHCTRYWACVCQMPDMCRMRSARERVCVARTEVKNVRSVVKSACLLTGSMHLVS